CILVVGTIGQPLDRAGAVCRLPEKISGTTAVRTEDQAEAVTRPHRIAVEIRIECHAGERGASKIPDPDIELLVLRSHSDPVAIGRQSRLSVRPWRRGDWCLPALPVHPYERAIHPSAAPRNVGERTVARNHSVHGTCRGRHNVTDSQYRRATCLEAG